MNKCISKAWVKMNKDKAKDIPIYAKYDKKAKVYVNDVKERIVSNYVIDKVRERKNEFIKSKDCKLKDCVLNLEENSKSDFSILSPFYLSNRIRPLKEFSKKTQILNNANKGRELYDEYFTKLIHRNHKRKGGSKLIVIWNKYKDLVKDGKQLSRSSQQQCKHLKRQWTAYGHILTEVKKAQDKFEDPEANFNYYVWKVANNLKLKE